MNRYKLHNVILLISIFYILSCSRFEQTIADKIVIIKYTTSSIQETLDFIDNFTKIKYVIEETKKYEPNIILYLLPVTNISIMKTYQTVFFPINFKIKNKKLLNRNGFYMVGKLDKEEKWFEYFDNMVTYKNKDYYSLELRIAMKYLKIRRPIYYEQYQNLKIEYNRSYKFQTIPFNSLNKQIKDKIVIIGFYCNNHFYYPTPIGYLSDKEIVAFKIYTLLKRLK